MKLRARVAGCDRFERGSRRCPEAAFASGSGSSCCWRFQFPSGCSDRAFGVAEGFGGVIGGAAAIFVGQALVYAAILYALAALLVRAVGRFRTQLLGFAALLLVAACFVRIYHSPYHARTSQVTLLEVCP